MFSMAVMRPRTIAEADVLADLVVVSQVSTGAQGAGAVATAESER